MENRRNMRTVDGSVARPQMPMRQMQQPANAGHPAVKLALLRMAGIGIAVALAIGTPWIGVLSLLDMVQGHPLSSWHGLLAWCGDRLWVVWVVCGVLVIWNWVVPGVRKVDDWWGERQAKKSQRDLKKALATNAEKGFNTKYANAGTGEVWEQVNPASITPASRTANNYYGIQQEQEKQQERLQIAAPGVSVHLTDDYAVPADDLLSGRKLIVGQSGYGKSNTVGTLIEELGGLEVPLVLADTEDEYRPLCNPRWLPHGMLADATSVTPDNAYQFGQYVLQEMMQVILNLQSYDEMKEAALVMIGIIRGMRDWEEEREDRIPSEFVMEEAPTWLPQNIKESPLYGTDTLNMLQGTVFNDMVRKGRKRGLGLTVVCQKVAEVDKRALQADTKILHYQNEEPDLKHYAGMGIKMEETLKLQTGDAYLFTKHTSKQLIHVRRRHSPHGANTPGLAALRRHQQTRNLPETASETGRNYGEITGQQASGYEIFERPVEPFQNISAFRQPEKSAAKNPYEGIPEMLIKEIEEAYERRGFKDRVDIRDELQLNGDQYWMIRNVCNEYDKKRKEG